MQKEKYRSTEKDAYKYIAPVYSWLEKIVFGRALSRSRRYGLDKVREGSKVLILGGGSGEVLKYLSDCEIDYVENSESMIFRTSRKVEDQIVHFHHLPFSEYRSSIQYDHIICQYFMDIFEEEELLEIMGHIGQLSAEHTKLHLADFRITARGSGVWWQKPLVKLMYFFFRITTGLKTRELPSIEEIMKRSGYAEMEGRSWMNGLVFASVWSRRANSSDP